MLKRFFTVSAPWLFSVITVVGLLAFLLFVKQPITAKEKTVVINQVDVALPIPPPPPPPQQQVQSQSSTASINVIGSGNGPKLSFNEKPSMQFTKQEAPQLKAFEMNAQVIKQRMEIDMPLFAVEALDSIPKVISQKYFPIPLAIRKQGIKRVATEVELVIDVNGKPFIKKIIDPIYPEMVEVIRQWVSNARFEIPKKDGKAVQAIYLYGINFNYGR